MIFMTKSCKGTVFNNIAQGYYIVEWKRQGLSR